MGEVTVITNNVPRDVIDAWELTPKEREQFDYIDWASIEAGSDSASFVRYKGELYDLGDIMRTESLIPWMMGWDGYVSNTFLSGILFRYYGLEPDQIIVGRYYS